VRKKLIKLSISLLVLSSAALSRDAEILGEKYHNAVKKIHACYWDYKLNDLFRNFETGETIADFDTDKIKNLNNQTNLKDIINIADYFLRGIKSQDSSNSFFENLNYYKAYIKNQQLSDNTIRRQLAFLFAGRYRLLQKKPFKIESLKRQLHEPLHSSISFFKFNAYVLMSEAYQKNGQTEQATLYIKKSLELPEEYHVPAYLHLLKFPGINQHEYQNQRYNYLEKIIESGAPEYKFIARKKIFLLHISKGSPMYNLDKARNIYNEIFENLDVNVAEADNHSWYNYELFTFLSDIKFNLKSEDFLDAKKCLIDFYIKKNNLEIVVEIYDHILTFAESCLRTNTIKEYIDFLDDPKHIRVQIDPELLIDLKTELREISKEEWEEKQKKEWQEKYNANLNESYDSDCR
jgi:hypothetical protein